MENTNIVKKKIDVGQTIFIIAMLIIPIISFLFFYVYININSFLMAFQIPLYDGLGGVRWGFDNFEKIISQFFNTEEDLLLYIRNGVIFYCQDTFISMPLSLIICYFIYKKIACFKAFRVIIYLPIIIPGTVFVTLYKTMIEAGGPYQMLCGKFGVEPPTTFIFNEQYALKTILIYVIYSGLGGRFILFGGAMNAIEPSIIEAAKLDGAGPFRELISIILPCIWPTFATMVLLSSTGLFTASGPLLLFDKGDYGTCTISYWIYKVTTGDGGAGESYELAAATGMIFTILTLPIVFITKSLTKITEDN
ncbi:MAG: sugar ABC transporter permease [Clostridia bacterium]|nr:sugar ABC transporter permease [Clostridia bacterium]